MLVLKIFTFRVIVLIFLLVLSCSFLYMLLKLQDEEDTLTDCSWCRSVGYESVGEGLDSQGEVDDDVMATFETPMFVKQLHVVENGESVLYHDQFVLRGLLQFSSIRKNPKNIFFVKSSCVLGVKNNDGVEFKLNAREACGLESAARANPDRPVYLLHSCPLADDFALRVPEHARGLLELHNVYVVVLDLAELSHGWSDPLPFSSTSLGLLALWQFGGTYCSLDTLTLRSLRPLGTNYCGYHDDNLIIGDAVFNFEPQGYGHTMVAQLLHDLSNVPEKVQWQEDSPHLTQTVIQECNQLPRTRNDCNKLTIYLSNVLFTVGLNHRLFLSENLAHEFGDIIKMTAYTINYFSRLHSFSEGQQPDQVLFNLAKEFCPDVYKRNNYKV